MSDNTYKREIPIYQLVMRLRLSAPALLIKNKKLKI